MIKLIALMSALTLTFHGRMVSKRGNIGLNTCTAIYVSPHEALTAAHCVAFAAVPERMWVKTDGNKSFSVNVVAKDVINDLALLDIDGPPAKNYAKLATRPLKKGDRVYLVSSELDFVGTYSEGYIANFVLDTFSETTPVILHTAPIKSGASGSGLFNSHGELIGINVLSAGTLSEAVDIHVVRKFLEDNSQYL